MVPAAFVLLESLPLTSNGKLDRERLPAPELSRPDLGTSYMAPRGELERILAAVWQAALKLDKVGIHDNFFDLGGHSLLLVEVHNQLCASFQQLALIDMFKYPTISALAAHLSSDRHHQATVLEDVQDRARKQRAARDRRRQVIRASST
jgi:hypothetical protein